MPSTADSTPRTVPEADMIPSRYRKTSCLLHPRACHSKGTHKSHKLLAYHVFRVLWNVAHTSHPIHLPSSTSTHFMQTGHLPSIHIFLTASSTRAYKWRIVAAQVGRLTARSSKKRPRHDDFTKNTDARFLVHPFSVHTIGFGQAYPP